MRITKKRLRKIIREACGLAADHSDTVEMPAMMPPAVSEEMPTSDPDVPSPQDYDLTRSFMTQNPDLVDLGLSLVMDMAGTSCERSTAQGMIDHLQDMVDGSSQPSAGLPPMIEV